jgi:hypothetical protein
LRRVLIISFAVGLGACGAINTNIMRAKVALFGPHRHAAAIATIEAPPPAPPPPPAEGLWAVLDPGCPKPQAADIQVWPKCAFPFWISGGKALVVRSAGHKSRPPTDASFVADYSLTAGEPVIAQVGTEKDGYMFLALTQLSQDSRGRLVGAVGAAVACSRPSNGALAIKPNLNGCQTESLEAVRKAAAETLLDRTVLDQVAWIAAGAPEGAPIVPPRP